MISSSRGFNIQQRTISGELFAALGIPIVAGRSFDDRDHAGVPAHAVVSASFARQAFPGLVFEAVIGQRSEEHTSELQSRLHLVCRLLLEKKKKKQNILSEHK